MAQEGIPGVTACMSTCGVSERPPGFAELEACVAIGCPDSGDECATPDGYVAPNPRVCEGSAASVGSGTLADCAFDNTLTFDLEGEILQLETADKSFCVRLEREWYGIDHSGVAMGILVNTRTKSELANIVAFTGNPLLRGDDRYLVNAQLGELDVVSALPGVWPEKDLLTIDNGSVVGIDRVRGTTELADGEWVLSNAQLEELGAGLANIAQIYPVDEDVPAAANVLLDTEWKLRSDGRLAIKQIRPFLQ